MKYLESFENQIKKFRKGDIVKLRRNNSNMFIITNIEKIYGAYLSFYYPEYDDEKTDYRIAQKRYTYFDIKDIRHLTKKEQEEVELKKAAKKYNL
jgi:hypothetical protein